MGVAWRVGERGERRVGEENEGGSSFTLLTCFPGMGNRTGVLRSRLARVYSSR